MRPDALAELLGTAPHSPPPLDISTPPCIVTRAPSCIIRSGPSSIRVGPNSTGAYPLDFAPEWTVAASGELILTNGATGEKYVYTLKGKGEEPLAEVRTPPGILEATSRYPHRFLPKSSLPPLKKLAHTLTHARLLLQAHIVFECEARTPKPLTLNVFNVSGNGAACNLKARAQT